jgi:hypothetical protein
MYGPLEPFMEFLRACAEPFISHGPTRRELLQSLRDTDTAIARLEREVATRGESTSLTIAAASLHKRRRRIEAEIESAI